MAATYCYKKGQSGLVHTWKLRYFEYDATTKILTYRTTEGGKVQGSFEVSGVKDHDDTPGHSQVFEISHKDGHAPLLCAGLVAGKGASDPSSYPEAKSLMMSAIQASFGNPARDSLPQAPPVAFGIMSTAEITGKTMPGMATVVAVASRDVAKAQAFIEKNAKLTKSGDKGKAVTYDDIVAHPDVEAIYCPLPTGLRNQWISKAIAAGKHIYSEKPMGGTVSELKALLDECAAKGVQWMDGTM